MIARNPKSITMFNEDFTKTYGRIASRTVEILAEEAANGGGEGEMEQIQLVAEDPNVQIGFNLPDGPPPADLRVEGEGSEEMDIEQVSLCPQTSLLYNSGYLKSLTLRFERFYRGNGIYSSNSRKSLEWLYKRKSWTRLIRSWEE